MDPACEDNSLTVEIELPSYTRRNAVRREWVLGAMLWFAAHAPSGVRVERYGLGGDEVHLLHAADEVTAMRLRLANRHLLRASYDDALG
jgi:hypothetical protein